MAAFTARARNHLAAFPLILPADGDDASAAAQKAVATDPGLFGALGGVTPTELRELAGPLPPRTIEGLILGLYDRVSSDMRILGTARVETALMAARRASHEPLVALKLGRMVSRLELGASWLTAAGIGPESVRRLAARTPRESDVHAVRSLYAMHRPTFADLRVRIAASPVWTPSPLPTLREAVLAAAGLSCAPISSLVRQAIGGRPWGRGEPLAPSKLGSRAAARILIESLRCLGLSTTSLGAGLVLLAGLYDTFGKSEETTGVRIQRVTTPADARPVVARDVTTTVRIVGE